MNLPLPKQKPRNRVRARLHEIIFEADTGAGRALRPGPDLEHPA